MSTLFLLLASTYAPFSMGGEISYPLIIPPSEPGTEHIFSMKVEANCTISGKIIIPEYVISETPILTRIHRFDLFPSTGEAKILLGSFPTEVKAQIILQSTHCPILNPSWKVEAVTQSLSLIHSPCINVRDDQYENLYTDRPRKLLYDYEDFPGESFGIGVRYTMIFTDEDSKTGIKEEKSMRAKYGRSTDIESVNFTKLDSPTGGPIFFQSGLSLSSDCPGFSPPWHTCKTFAGDFLNGTRHPILYNATRNNLFSDSPSEMQGKSGLELYCLLPSLEIPSPRAREWAMFQEPSLFKDSDEELEAENKLPRKSTDYLYVRITGVLDAGYGGFLVRLNLSTGETLYSGDSEGRMNELGEDLWHRESFMSIPLEAKKLDQILQGKISGFLDFAVPTWAMAAFHEIRFFRLVESGKTYASSDITGLLPNLECKLDGLSTVCSFGPDRFHFFNLH